MTGDRPIRVRVPVPARSRPLPHVRMGQRSRARARTPHPGNFRTRVTGWAPARCPRTVSTWKHPGEWNVLPEIVGNGGSSPNSVLSCRQRNGMQDRRSACARGLGLARFLGAGPDPDRGSRAENPQPRARRRGERWVFLIICGQPPTPRLGIRCGGGLSAQIVINPPNRSARGNRWWHIGAPATGAHPAPALQRGGRANTPCRQGSGNLIRFPVSLRGTTLRARDSHPHHCTRVGKRAGAGAG